MLQCNIQFKVIRRNLTSHPICVLGSPGVVNFSEPEMANKQTSVAPRNRLLVAFESESRARVDPLLERIDFRLGDVVCEVGSVLI